MGFHNINMQVTYQDQTPLELIYMNQHELKHNSIQQVNEIAWKLIPRRNLKRQCYERLKSSKSKNIILERLTLQRQSNRQKSQFNFTNYFLTFSPPFSKGMRIVGDCRGIWICHCRYKLIQAHAAQDSIPPPKWMRISPAPGPLLNVCHFTSASLFRDSSDLDEVTFRGDFWRSYGDAEVTLTKHQANIKTMNKWAIYNLVWKGQLVPVLQFCMSLTHADK